MYDDIRKAQLVRSRRLYLFLIRYAIGNISEKDLSKIIKEFEEIGKIPYEKKIPIHEPTESYFHLSREIVKCIMRSDKLNW